MSLHIGLKEIEPQIPQQWACRCPKHQAHPEPQLLTEPVVSSMKAVQPVVDIMDVTNVKNQSCEYY